MAAGLRWVDGSYRLFVEPRLIGNLDVVSVRVAEETFLEIGDGCVFTSLSTDMQRAAPEYRKRFEDIIVRIYELFSGAIHAAVSDALQRGVPRKGPVPPFGYDRNDVDGPDDEGCEPCLSGFGVRKKALIEAYVAPENRTPIRATALVNA